MRPRENPLEKLEHAAADITNAMVEARDRLGDAIQAAMLVKEQLKKIRAQTKELREENTRLRAGLAAK